MLTNFQLRKYLAREVLCKTLRKPSEKERRGPERNEPYRAWIRTLACTACGIEGRSEAAHTGRDGGMSQKASDLSCIPLCRDCHTMRADSYHRIDGGKRAFERRYHVSFAREVKRLNAEWRELTQAA
jgi:hypothetical protein